jgi:bile acid-coenzyme A ligase
MTTRPRVPIGRLIGELAAAEPDRPAVTCGDATLSRAALDRASNRLARAYEGLGVGPGSFVSIALPNGVEFFVVACAAWKLGAVVQPVSSKLPPEELAAIIDLVDPALVVGVDHPSRVCVPAGFEPDAELADTPIVPDRVSPAWKAPTSGGSTGRPKVIVAGAAGAVDPAGIAWMGVEANGVVLVPGPLYHNAPFAAGFQALFYGNHVVVLERFEATAALETIEAYRVQFAIFVPTMLSRMLRVLREGGRNYDLSFLRALWHMAAPCPPPVKEAWIELVGPDRLFELYGGTEGQAMTTISGREWLEHRGSVGRPVFGEVIVLDEAGRPVPPGTTGEIWMRRPTGTRPTYRYLGAETRERDGWESIGDLGWLDQDGYLYIADRRTDLVISGGANIYPAEVEAALVAHPLVHGAVVVGVPDDDLGQRLHAVVQADGPLQADDLAAFVSTRLVRYKIPRSFRIVTEALHDDAGKARRSAVRDREAALN